jgi:hypothetical protein
LNADEPRDAGEEQRRGHVDVETKPEEMVGGIDSKDLLEDAKSGVAGDV